MRRVKNKRISKEDITAAVLNGRRERRRANNFPPARSELYNFKTFPNNNTKRSILIWINTYNRPKDLKNLLKDIYVNKKKHKIKVLVIDDNSEMDYEKTLNSFSGKLNIEYHKMSFNHGKKEYWRLCTYAMNEIKTQMGYDYYLKLDDDGRLVPNFFDKCIYIWESIRDPRKMTLNFRLDSREKKKVWTNVAPMKVQFNNIDLYRAQWVDMDFFTTFNFFIALRFQIDKPTDVRWKNPFMSSGTGRDISKRLVKMGYNLYLTTQTLVIHDEHDSKMNPGERARHPLVTKKITDPSYGEK